MARVKQPVSINGLEFDALIEENRTLEAEVPEYTVEGGFSISDAIVRKSESLEMTLFVTDTPVTWRSRHGVNNGRVEQAVAQLEAMYYAGQPVTVTTSERAYTNMAITSVSFRKSLETGYSREIPISFRKIRTTASRTTHIPESYGKSGATGASAGSANTTTEESGGGSNGGSEADSSSGKSVGALVWDTFTGVFS